MPSVKSVCSNMACQCQTETETATELQDAPEEERVVNLHRNLHGFKTRARGSSERASSTPASASTNPNPPQSKPSPKPKSRNRTAPPETSDDWEHPNLYAETIPPVYPNPSSSSNQIPAATQGPSQQFYIGEKGGVGGQGATKDRDDPWSQAVQANRKGRRERTRGKQLIPERLVELYRVDWHNTLSTTSRLHDAPSTNHT